MIKNRTKISRIDLAEYAKKQLFCSVKILLNMDILKKLLFLTFLSGFMASCSNEDEYADGTGFLSFGYLGVDTEVISMLPQSRMVEEGENKNPGGGESENEDPLLPYIEDGFKVMVLKDESLVYECKSYDDYKSGELENVELRAGNYNVYTFLGNVSLEGFEVNPCYGDTIHNVMVNRGKSSTVTFECSVINSLLKVNYTENFKKYFSKYSVNVSSSLGNNIEYSMEETRSAYLSPGTVKVNVTARKEGGQEATFVVGDYDLLSRYEYELTLDVEAASSKMIVTFNDDVDNAEPVTIDVSDEAFNAAVPRIVASEGFESGKVVECIEGTLLSRIHSLSLNAEGMIGKCELTTTSEFLKSKGWPSEGTLDMVSMTPEQELMLKDLGLKYKGLGTNAGQMAYLDFTNFISNMPSGELVEVNVNVTDRFGHSVETPFVVSTNNALCQFNVAFNDEVDFLGNEFKVDLSFLDGTPENVKYSLTDGGDELEVLSIEEAGQTGELKHYTVTLRAKNDFQFKKSFQLKSKYLSYNTDTDVDVAYGILLDNGEGDVWAKRVYMHVYNVPEGEMQFLKVHKKESEGEWTEVEVQNVEVSGTNLIVKGLSSNTQQQIRIVKDGKEPTNAVDVKTEDDVQIPNSGFEDWHTETFEFTVTWTGKGYRDWYLPWNEGEARPVWAVNSKKTMLSECTRWNLDYKVFPTVSWSSSNKSEGKKSAQISTVATGAWAIPSGGSVTPHAGELWLGTADNGGNHVSEGLLFNSRPSSVSFWYQYIPVSSENFYFKIELKSDDGSIIASNEIVNGSQENGGDIMTVPLIYQDKYKKPSSVFIIFKSSTKSSPQYNTGFTMEIAGKNQTSHIGSVLRIDDLKLIYE